MSKEEMNGAFGKFVQDLGNINDIPEGASNGDNSKENILNIVIQHIQEKLHVSPNDIIVEKSEGKYEVFVLSKFLLNSDLGLMQAPNIQVNLPNGPEEEDKYSSDVSKSSATPGYFEADVLTENSSSGGDNSEGQISEAEFIVDDISGANSSEEEGKNDEISSDFLIYRY